MQSSEDIVYDELIGQVESGMVALYSSRNNQSDLFMIESGSNKLELA